MLFSIMNLFKFKCSLSLLKTFKQPNYFTKSLPYISEKTDLKLNKIRNSIAHFDWTLNNGAIIFRDKNFKISVNYFEISEFCSLISMIAIFMTNNINKIE